MRKELSLAWLTILTAAAMGLGLSAPLAAQQGQDGKTFEKGIETGLRDVINRGATIFNNQGDYAGCYRLYEGALRTIKPLLSSNPPLQKKIEEGLANANLMPSMPERAHALRKVLDDVRVTLDPTIARKDVAKDANKQPQPAKKESTLWDRLGGEAGVNKVLADLFATAAPDPKVDFTRGGKYPLTPENARVLQKSVLDFVSSATGGPFKYTGLSMKDAHKGMGITNDQFDAFAGHLKAALEKNGVQAADVAAILAAIDSTRSAIVEPPEKKGEDKKEEKKKSR